MNNIRIYDGNHLLSGTVKDNFLEDCPKDHKCCLLDMGLFNTNTFKKKRAKEFFYMSEQDFIRYSEEFSGILFHYFFNEINPKKSKPKYENWTWNGHKEYFFSWGSDDCFKKLPFMCSSENLRTEYPSFFKGCAS